MKEQKKINIGEKQNKNKQKHFLTDNCVAMIILHNEFVWSGSKKYTSLISVSKSLGSPRCHGMSFYCKIRTGKVLGRLLLLNVQESFPFTKTMLAEFDEQIFKVYVTLMPNEEFCVMFQGPNLLLGTTAADGLEDMLSKKRTYKVEKHNKAVTDLLVAQSLNKEREAMPEHAQYDGGRYVTYAEDVNDVRIIVTVDKRQAEISDFSEDVGQDADNEQSEDVRENTERAETEGEEGSDAQEDVEDESSGDDESEREAEVEEQPSPSQHVSKD